MTTLRAGSATDVGRVRRINQDRALESASLFAVADGMGGHVGGEVAAQTAIDGLRAAWEAAGPDPHRAEALVGAVQDANRAVWGRALADQDLRGMGTTLTAVALVDQGEGDELALANVGDSRAYLLSAGQLTQLTADHSLVAEAVRSGELSAEEALSHPKRHILTRVLGLEPEVDVDAWRMAPVAGDRILLCSDGLFNEVEEADLAGVLAGISDPAEAAATLVALARDHGGSDNITVVVVDVVDVSGAKGAPAAGATASSGEAAPDGSAGADPAGSAQGEPAESAQGEP
ncbi:MAG: Stp1/IreP family PP2C-type Ser/Thr phosphatase, partial [Acidimicrobiales bacterium]